MSKIEVNAIEPQSGTTLTIGASGDIITIPAGSAAAPVITTTGDTNTGMFFPAADTIAFTEGGTEAMRIDSSGNVGVRSSGGTTPTYDFNTLGEGLFLRYWDQSGARHADLVAIGNTPAGATQDMRFFTNSGGAPGTATERMRIASDGHVIIGRTTTSSSTPGVHFSSNGQIVGVRGSDYIAYFNRQNDDGNLVLFAQADATEGTISVSGATVSYNGFTGSHWSRFIDESKPDVLRGTVIESLDQMTDWYNAEFETSYTEKDADGNDVVKTTYRKKTLRIKS
jgi:hypothetical protein